MIKVEYLSWLNYLLQYCTVDSLQQVLVCTNVQIDMGRSVHISVSLAQFLDVQLVEPHVMQKLVECI
jgi:hypothetical protein